MFVSCSLENQYLQTSVVDSVCSLILLYTTERVEITQKYNLQYGTIPTCAYGVTLGMGYSYVWLWSPEVTANLQFHLFLVLKYWWKAESKPQMANLVTRGSKLQSATGCEIRNLQNTSPKSEYATKLFSLN